MKFDSTAQKLHCPYCDNEFEVSALSSFEEQLQDEKPDQMDWDVSAGSEWEEHEEQQLRTYVCNSCGGEIMADENTAATSCPFCGNPVVLTERVSGQLRPDYVIPFKLNKEAAKEAYRRHLKGKILLPKKFQDENHIDEIKGVYVPYWLFDADVDASFRYSGTKESVWETGDYIYTRTSFYSIVRQGRVGFTHIPIDGSSSIADDLMEAIEPFDFSDAVDFQTAYLAGYLADKYDVGLKESYPRATERIKKSTADMFRNTVHGYMNLNEASGSMQLQDGDAKYALYPVWLLATTWKDQHFLFAMNGQTGKMVGDLPADSRKFWSWELLLTVGIGLLAFLIIRFFV